VQKHLAAADAPGHVQALRHALASAVPWDEATLERELRTVAEARGVKASMLIHATRLAISGRMVSPGLFEMLVLVGRERVLARLGAFVATLGARA
jgi:glutamyl-tRNA synthetase